MPDRQDHPPDAPQTAQQAAEQLHELGSQLDERRRTAARMRAARDDAQRLYQQQKHRGYIAVDGRNAQVREGKVMDTELDADTREDAAELADRLGLKRWTPETVDDLRWLRDRGEGIAEACSAAAYDTRARVAAWQTVAGWARAEYEQTHTGSHESEGT